MHVKKAIEYRAMNLENLTAEEYYHLEDMGMLYVYFPEATGSYDNDMKRIDKIGQNGNDGMHYDELGETYAEKIARIYDIQEDHMMDGDDWDETYCSETYSDPVSPKHYQIGDTGVEAIDIIKASLNPREFIGYCRGNILKYQIRASDKNGDEDLQKADVYSGWLVEALEGLE